MEGTYKKSKGNAGLSGVQFQLNLLTVILLNALRRLKGWKISTENEAAGKYDDIVLELADESAVLFQAKFKANKKITRDQLLSSNSKNADFSLPKYFFSYYEINSKFKVKAVFICTNTDLEEKGMNHILNRQDIGCDSELYYEGGSSSYLTFHENILPELRSRARIYYKSNLEGKGIDEDIITDENLKVFLEKLKYVVNYPNGKNINTVIQQLLSCLKSYNLATGVSIKEIYEKVEDWFKQTRGEYLTELRAAAMFSEIRSDRYCRTLKGHNVSFESNNFKFTDAARIYHVKSEDGYLLQALKIYSALQNDQSNKLYLDPEEDLEVQKQVVEAFKLKRFTFLVIVWFRFKDESIIKEISNTLTGILDQCTYKKVILVSEDDNKLVQQIGKQNDVVDVDGVVKFKELSNDTKKALVKIKNINFQGRSVDLEELLGEQTVEYLTKAVKSQILQKLIKGENVKVGAPILGLDENVAKYYIERTFKTDKSKMEDFRETTEEITETFPEQIVFDVNEKLILISDSAGMGKSVVLAKLEEIVKEKHPDLWVIRVALNNYTSILSKNIKNIINVMDLLNSEEVTKLTNELEKFVFSMDQKVVLILDGVDEISPDYTELMLRLLEQCLESPNFKKVLISTRPHLKRELEAKLNVKSLTLSTFTEENQTDFLMRYWVHNLSLTNDRNIEKCVMYAEALLKKMRSWTRSYEYIDNNFAAIPLLVRMLAEVFMENTESIDSKEWEGCKEYLVGTEWDPRLPKNMNIIELYQMFIDKKRNIFISKGNPTGHPWVNRALSQQFDKCQAHHRNLALKVIVGSSNASLFSNCQPQEEDMETVLEIGIVQKVDNNFHFLHRTFAEYFVAECSLRELQLQNKDDQFQRFFIEELLCKSEYFVLRSFLNNLLLDVVDSLPSDIFQSYQSCTYVYEEDFLDDVDIVFVLVEEGCVAILRLIFKCINFKVVKDKEVDIQDVEMSAFETENTTNMLNFLQMLVKHGGINIINKFYETPLHRACQFGQLKMAKFLIEQGANVNSKGSCNYTPLHSAIRESKLELIEYLVEAGALIDLRNSFGSMAIHLAAMNGRLDIVTYFVNAGADVGAKDYDENTIMHLVSREGRLNIVEYLTEIGVDVNVTNDKNRTPLHLATMKGKLNVIQYFLEAGMEVGKKDIDGNTEIHLATEIKRLDIVKYLVELGVNANLTNHDGSTAVHLAVRRNWLEGVQYFVEIGADVSVKDNDGYTPLHFATLQGQLSTVEYFVDRVVEVIFTRIKDREISPSKVKNYRQSLFQNLKKFGANANVTNNIDCANLYLAISRGQSNIIRDLLKNSIYLTTIDNNGCTLLHLAAGRGDMRTVKTLVMIGADVSVRNKDGYTPLQLAVLQAQLSTVEYFVYLVVKMTFRQNGDDISPSEVGDYRQSLFETLKKFGANASIINSIDCVTLDQAISRGQWNIIRDLVKISIYLNTTDNHGCTLLHLAAGRGDVDTVQFFVDIGADFSVMNRDGYTPLQLATLQGARSTVEYFVDRVVEVSFRRIEDREISPSKVEGYRQSLFQNLKKFGANASVTNNIDCANLDQAISRGQSNIIRDLVKNSIYLTTIDNNGCTLLHLAAGRGDMRTVKTLVKIGADVSVRNKDGYTPLQLATFQGRFTTVKYFVGLVVKRTFRQSEGHYISPSEVGDYRQSLFEALKEFGANASITNSIDCANLDQAISRGQEEDY